MVHELTGLVGEPQNLVSYHLGKLRTAGLVSARRSSADRRDSYYAVDLGRVGDLLTATGAALHPALDHAPPPASARARRKARVLFLCTGNSGRSPMAEALLRARSGNRVAVRSAGSQPRPLHPAAVRVLRDTYGIDISGRRPKHLRSYAHQRFDWVITLCDRVREICPEFPGPPEAIHWSIPDPAAAHLDGDDAGDEAFARTAAELDTRIGFLLGAIARSGFAANESPEGEEKDR